ncbi:lantibiotic dehydratase [Acrocarpospora macrocephala]|uniref:lantibiotic dehydratase n=1 Tax=Acrocarpospora macrocephala TaxID=150177 RepID=UPI0012D2E5F1
MLRISGRERRGAPWHGEFRVAASILFRRIGNAHRPRVRVTAEWLTAVVRQLEGETALRRRLTVTANNLAFERDGRRNASPTPSSAALAVLRLTLDLPAGLPRRKHAGQRAGHRETAVCSASSTTARS